MENDYTRRIEKNDIRNKKQYFKEESARKVRDEAAAVAREEGKEMAKKVAVEEANRVL